jgi:hypothetical protein
MPHYVVPRSEPASVRVVVSAGTGTCSAQATYRAKLDPATLDDWKYARDMKWSSLHASGGHIVNVER